MDKVVVFGGAGFLGSHVADVLSGAGYKVVIYDRIPSPYLRASQEMVVGDILDENLVTETVRDARFVYNFAGIADVEEASNRPLDTIKYNILGHTIILNACARARIERVLFASSIYVYSNSGSFYRVSKQSCELITEAFFEQFGLSYTILRYGSLYGPRAQMWNGVYRLIYHALMEGRIDYPGKGEEKREYIHVTDAARLSVEAVKEEFRNEYIIITGTQSMSSREFLTMINEMLGNKITIKFTGKKRPGHYTISPYTFSPKLGKKLVSNSFVDIGQGILHVMDEILRVHYKDYKTISDIYIKDDES